MTNFNAKECKSERHNCIVLLMNIMGEILDPLSLRENFTLTLAKPGYYPIHMILSFTCIPKESIMSLLHISIVVVSRSLSEDCILIGIKISYGLLVLHMSLHRLQQDHDSLMQLCISTESVPFFHFDSAIEFKAQAVKYNPF